MSVLSSADWDRELTEMREHERRASTEVTSRSARISSCGKYRYTLWRSWAPIAGDSKLMLFVMLNPSIADANIDDPTIRKCIGYAQREGFDHLMVVNLYAYRSTDPDVMLRLGAEEARGPDNKWEVREACTNANRVVLAWGNPGGSKLPLWFNPDWGPFFCLGTNKDGSPKHPLYLAKDTPLIPWNEK